MLRYILKTLVFVLFCIFVSENMYAQDKKLDFKAEWKKDSAQNIIKVTILSGEPLSVMIYDKSPFEKGILLSQTSVLSNSTIEIVADKKTKLCVCLINAEEDFKCKELEIEK
jgi:hypothetical protein